MDEPRSLAGQHHRRCTPNAASLHCGKHTPPTCPCGSGSARGWEREGGNISLPCSNCNRWIRGAASTSSWHTHKRHPGRARGGDGDGRSPEEPSWWCVSSSGDGEGNRGEPKGWERGLQLQERWEQQLTDASPYEPHFIKISGPFDYALLPDRTCNATEIRYKLCVVRGGFML